jgi:hypothetical protein
MKIAEEIMISEHGNQPLPRYFYLIPFRGKSIVKDTNLQY